MAPHGLLVASKLEQTALNASKTEQIVADRKAEQIAADRKAEQIAADRKADADIALFERICEEAPALFNQSDVKIAADCEELFGIPAKDTLAQFAREDETSFPTVELIMMAHDPHFFGS